MSILINFEFKAKVASLEPYENKLLSLKPDFKGIDHQVDYYFHTEKGRLKLRTGNIENALIHYDRSDSIHARESKVILYKHVTDASLKEILSIHLGVKTVVDKIRKIYFVENVKFHLDLVHKLGTFIEVEAIDGEGQYSIEHLQAQCAYYMEFFGLKVENMIAKSYADLIMESRV